MQLAAIFVLCLAITVQAEPSIFDAISEGANAAGSIAKGAVGAVGSVARSAVDVATEIGKGVIGAKAGTIANLSNVASSFGKSIADGMNAVQSRILKSVLQQVQNVLQNIQNASRGALHAYEQAAKNIKGRIIKLEQKQLEDIEAYADKAKNKLANSTDDAQMEGQHLVDEFANQRSEELRKCTDDVVGQLEQLQEKANSTAQRFHEPMNKLVQQVAKCSELKANDFKRLAPCANDIRKDLSPLAAAPDRLAVVKAQIVRVGLTNLRKNVCVALALRKFNKEASRVDKQIDQLVADDKKQLENETETEDQPADETTHAEETTQADEASTSPADEANTSPADDAGTSPADDDVSA